MSDRDEQLEALKAIVSEAKKKLKSAEISAADIEEKLKTNEEEFQRKLSEKSAGYKAQTGAQLNRNVDVNGKVTYDFSRETTPEERKKDVF